MSTTTIAKPRSAAKQQARKASKLPGHHRQARGRVPAPTAFGRVLYACISRRGWSANHFARMVGMSSGFVSGVYSGLKKPPVERLGDWAKKLQLSKEEAAAFVLLAELEHVKTSAPTVYKTLCTAKFEDVVTANSPEIWAAKLPAYSK